MDFSNFNISEFKVVVQGIRAITNAEMRIQPAKIEFNAMAAAEMGYPAYVRVLISPDATRVIIDPCREKDKYAIPFYREKRSKKTGAVLKNASISITDSGLAKGIRQKMKWAKGTYRCPAIRFDEKPKTLFFDLSQADNTKRKTVKAENILDCYPPIGILIADMHPLNLLPASYASEPLTEKDPLAEEDPLNVEDPQDVIEVAYRSGDV